LAMGPLYEQAELEARKVIAANSAAGSPELTMSQLGALPSVGVRDRILRSSQEMLWRRTSETFDRHRVAFRESLDSLPDKGLELSDLPLAPDYLRDYHLQPGGYHGDELAGHVYHYGTKIFWLGHNDRDQAKTAIVHSVPTPEDGVVTRVLELACSVGQSTTAFKERFPDAEVWGVDLAAPILRYAHERATRLGADVNFSQQPAEALTFEPESFDLVFASLLFHEIPVAVGEEAVRQVARVLRPGGLFVVNDLNPESLQNDEWGRYDRWWDTVHNAEPYELDFLQSDFLGALQSEFSDVKFDGNGYAGRWIARK
jgi:SAM-dependent methyltransferase